MITLPPFYGLPVSTLPPDPRLPTLPTQEELDATLAMFDELAQRDADRRAAKYNKTVRPQRIRK